MAAISAATTTRPTRSRQLSFHQRPTVASGVVLAAFSAAIRAFWAACSASVARISRCIRSTIPVSSATRCCSAAASASSAADEFSCGEATRAPAAAGAPAGAAPAAPLPGAAASTTGTSVDTVSLGRVAGAIAAFGVALTVATPDFGAVLSRGRCARARRPGRGSGPAARGRARRGHRRGAPRRRPQLRRLQGGARLPERASPRPRADCCCPGRRQERQSAAGPAAAGTHDERHCRSRPAT